MKKDLKKKTKSKRPLTFAFAIFVFLILVAAIAITIPILYLLSMTGLLEGGDGELSIGMVILFMSIISLLIGGLLTYFSIRIPLRPINNLISKMNSLAKGDFGARLEFGTVVSSHPAFKEVAESFNKMASELENTELLRSDFINDFSHEFKTPIASISGLARLLANAELPEEERKIYLKSIEEESSRLSSMATNILNLSRIEKQTILTGVTSFNLSEQVRSAVLLFEEKWEKKNIDLQLDFDEYEIEANEELLKEIWINLIDNALKFTARCGTVALDISDMGSELSVRISNTGEDIPPESLDKIYNKFYQTDESHASSGNGIGLAIVKRIVDLHKGKISVKSEGGITAFTVTLPKLQAEK